MRQATELLQSHNPDLEASLIVSMLGDYSILGTSAGTTPPEAFYNETYRHVWAEAQRQYAEDGIVDIVSVTVKLTQQKIPNYQSLGLTLAGIMFDYEGLFLRAPWYAQEVRRLYWVRQKTLATGKYLQDIADPDKEPAAQRELEATHLLLDSLIHTDDGELSSASIARGISEASRYHSGFSALDQLTGGFASPGFNIMAARPSVGKSAFGRTIIRNAAAKGDRIFWYSQDQPLNQVMELELVRLLRKTTEQVRQMSEPDLADAIDRVRAEVWRNRVTFVDRPLHLDQLTRRIAESAPDFVVIDYVQQIATGHETEYESITAVSKALKALAFELRIPILALAQFNRQHTEGVHPSMKHVRGSGQLEQDADQFYALERDMTLAGSDSQPATVYVLKNKVGPTGKIGIIWNGQTASYESAAPSYHDQPAWNVN